ncbi:MAG TPA: Flp family type IVb pilin [Alphaproteobacteria bacterium]|nr:Flp family type IVb pilin [Alphaproteobacteria bacterium]
MHRLKAVLGYISQLRSGRGATAMEYGLIAALIAIVMIVAVIAAESGMEAVFNKLASNIGSSPH